MKIESSYKKFPVKNLPKRTGDILGGLDPHAVFTFSGKSAIALVLDYYRTEKILENKSSQVLVPHWLGNWVYMSMHNYSFPTTTMNDGVKGLLVYHQWGFPQKMEKILEFSKRHNLFVLEDCAHSFSSFYKGTRAGTFGDVSTWSLSKFFPSVVGGALYSKNIALLNFAKQAIKRSDVNLEKQVFSHMARAEKENTVENTITVERAYAVYHRVFNCPPYALQVAAKELASDALEKRKENFDALRNEFWGKEEKKLLADSDVCPWVTPLFFGKSKNRKVAHALSGCGIESGVYNFDINRNMLKPDFRECVPVPCHQGLGSTGLGKIIDTIRTVI